MDNPDIRWKQRFQNFEKMLGFLEDAMKIEEPDIVQKAGLIQFFEIGFELSWNVMKEYLESKGIIGMRSPRDSIKKAFEVELITDGHAWLEALQDRNLTSHTYNESMADEVIKEIVTAYYPLLQNLYERLKSEL